MTASWPHSSWSSISARNRTSMRCWRPSARCRGCASSISAAARGKCPARLGRWVPRSPATIRSSPEPSRPRSAPVAFASSRPRPTQFRNPMAPPILFSLFFRCTTSPPKGLRGRSARRGGCCGLRVACTSRNRWRKGRINLSWSYSMTKQPCAKRRPRRLPILPDRISRQTKSRPTRTCGATPTFDAFSSRMIANMRFNGYTAEAVLAPAVRSRFAETYAAHGGRFDQPVRIDCLVRRVDAASVAHRISSCRSPHLPRRLDDKPSLAISSSTVMALPPMPLEKPHCGDSANCSSGA